ncbi:MAG: zf-HC2 domain-containing protein [Acidobacteriota bacterium]|nr:zf-HC2 domain-containing protein [Acidobacteriota bacterium]
MNCGETKDLIQLYLDNELDARSTLSMQQHLDSCSGCSRQLNILLLQDQTLKQAARGEIIDSSRVRAGILSAIAQETQAETPHQTTNWLPTHWFKMAAWPRIAAAAAFVLIAAFLALRGGWMPGVNETVYAAVAADHAAHCSADAMMGAVNDLDELRRLIRASAKVDALPDLSAFGYGNPQGRVCKVGNAEFLHLVYYHDSQSPLSLFLRHHDSTLVTEQLTALHSGNFNVVSISQGGVDLLVVSSLTEDQTSSITRALASRLLQ